MRGGYMREKDVRVEVDSYSKILVMGEVGEEGKY